MRIGILTHHYICNYGAFLQAWALQEAVKEMYPRSQVRIINYVPPLHALINTLGHFRFFPKKESIKDWREKGRQIASFRRAQSRYLQLTPPVHSTGQINALQFDCILIGSDEVWNYADRKSTRPVKFGVGLTCKRLVSYAPSAGDACVKGELPERFKEGIDRFTSLSARDDWTERMLKAWGKTPGRVLDPVFLTSIPDEYIHVKRPYILFYGCRNLSGKTWNDIAGLARSEGLFIYGAGEGDRRYADRTVNLTPFEWVHMFKKAKYVVTGTFHGVVFALLTRRRFVCCAGNASRREKVISLLNEFGLKQRMIREGENAADLLRQKIDYDFVEGLLQKKRRESKTFLQKGISGEDGMRWRR